TGELVRSFEGHSQPVTSVAFSSDGERVLSASADESVRLWNLKNGQIVRRLDGHRAAVYAAVFSRKGSHILSGGADGVVRLWDLEAGPQPSNRKIRRGGATAQQPPVKGPWVKSAGPLFLSEADGGQGRPTRSFKGHSLGVYCIAVSPDGRYALS